MFCVCGEVRKEMPFPMYKPCLFDPQRHIMDTTWAINSSNLLNLVGKYIGIWENNEYFCDVLQHTFPGRCRNKQSEKVS